MRATANTILVATALACPAALAISVYPGVLNGLIFPAMLLSCFVVPAVGIGALVALIRLKRSGELRVMRLPWRQAAVVAGLLFCTYVLLKFYVPRRIAFAASRASFEQLVQHAAPSDDEGTPLNRWLGVYRVEQFAVDPRGGVYFRVYSHGDGISPDRVSYGFTHKPNREGTPFGETRYRVFPLGHDWYWFRASDD